MPSVLLFFLLAGPAALAAESRVESHPFPFRRNISITLQSGFADTFQLTLGGTFGDGPALQNRITVTVAEVFRKGDSGQRLGSAIRSASPGGIVMISRRG